MGIYMQRSAHPALEAERDRAQREKYATLTAHYGEIGPAALLAALACLQQQKPENDARQPKASKAA